MTKLLEVEELTVAYGPVEAVRGISFHVSTGDVVALLGANGAGKSSTLRAVSGLERFGGSVTFAGMDVAKRSVAGLARAGLIHVPEGRRIFPTLSVNENLQVAEAAHGGRGEGFTIAEVYDLFPMLGDLANRSGWALSGGEQQMLALGRALISGPRLLLLDEPSLGLAPAIVEDVLAALRQLADRVPILLVEQNTHVALSIATRAMVLNNGEIVLTGSPDELRDRSALMNSYLGQSDSSTG